MMIYLSRAAAAATLTLGLFLLMRFLISPADQPALEESNSVDVRITREKRNEEPRRNELKLPQQPLSAPPPPPPNRQQNEVELSGSGGGQQYDWSSFEIDAGSMDMSSDRRAMPIVRIPPRYPERALTRNIEGWVLLEFTITEVGGVADVRVLDSDPPKLFDRESIRALQAWKYQPKMVDGKAVPQAGMQELIVFEITD